MNQTSGEEPVFSPRSELVLHPVEVVLSGIGHSRFLAWHGAGGGGGEAAGGVDPLDVGHPVENTRSVARYCSEEQPGDGGGVGGAALENHADHLAAADALPGGTGIVAADDAVPAGVGEQHRFGPLEDPNR